MSRMKKKNEPWAKIKYELKLAEESLKETWSKTSRTWAKMCRIWAKMSRTSAKNNKEFKWVEHELKILK